MKKVLRQIHSWIEVTNSHKLAFLISQQIKVFLVPLCSFVIFSSLFFCEWKIFVYGFMLFGEPGNDEFFVMIHWYTRKLHHKNRLRDARRRRRVDEWSKIISFFVFLLACFFFFLVLKNQADGDFELLGNWRQFLRTLRLWEWSNLAFFLLLNSPGIFNIHLWITWWVTIQLKTLVITPYTLKWNPALRKAD